MKHTHLRDCLEVPCQTNCLSSIQFNGTQEGVMRNIAYQLTLLASVFALVGGSFCHLQCGTTIAHDGEEHSQSKSDDQSLHRGCDCTECICHLTDLQIASKADNVAERISNLSSTPCVMPCLTVTAITFPLPSHRYRSQSLASDYQELLHRKSTVIQI